MKKIYLPLLTILLLLSCERNWDNLLSTDEDLKNTPNIIQINLDSEKNITIILNYAYSDLSSVILERRSVGGFETINYIRESQTTLTDTSFDKENSHNFVYRVSVTKEEHRSSYSDEKSFIYTSSGLNKPENLLAISVELQGIRLEWNDKSNYEDSYIIEKDTGSGFTEIATLSPNTESYFDAIAGAPPSPLQLDYRVKAYSSDLESDWAGIATAYSGMGSPTNLRITSSSSFNFTIEWIDNSNIETGFSIERKKDAGVFVEIDEVISNMTTYKDNIDEIGQYHYRIRAKNSNQYSSYSNEVFFDITFLIPTNGLLAYYPFDGNANDESGNGNHGTLFSGATANNVLSIGNNNSNYLSLPHTLLNGLSNFSLSARLIIKVPRTSGYTWHSWVSGANTSNYNAFLLGYYQTRQWSVHFMGTYAGGFQADTIFQDLDWHHIVFFREGSIAKIYIDNVEIGTGISVNPSPINLSPNGLIIGQDQDVLGGGFSAANSLAGELDNFRIYNRALTEEEIQALYQEGGWGK